MKIVLNSKTNQDLEIFSLRDLDNFPEAFEKFFSIKVPLEAKIFAINELISSHQLSQLKSHLKKINISSLTLYSNNRETIITGKSLRINSKFIKEEEVKKSSFF